MLRRQKNDEDEEIVKAFHNYFEKRLNKSYKTIVGKHEVVLTAEPYIDNSLLEEIPKAKVKLKHNEAVRLDYTILNFLLIKNTKKIS